MALLCAYVFGLGSDQLFIFIGLCPFSTKSMQGRQAMEFVISNINREVHELTSKTVKSVDTITGELTMLAKRAVQDDMTVHAAALGHQQDKSAAA